MKTGSDERGTLATLLMQNAEAVAKALRGSEVGSRLGTLSACVTLADLADQATRLLVADARFGGSTWAQVGDVLRSSRQAAQQRFKEGPGEPDEESEKLAAKALDLLSQWQAGRWSEVTADFDDTMRQRLDEAGLQSAWAQVEGLSGKLVSAGRPVVVARGRFRVVDVPLAFQRGPMKGRVAFNPEGRVSGLFVLYPDVP